MQKVYLAVVFALAHGTYTGGICVYKSGQLDSVTRTETSPAVIAPHRTPPAHTPSPDQLSPSHPTRTFFTAPNHNSATMGLLSRRTSVSSFFTRHGSQSDASSSVCAAAPVAAPKRPQSTRLNSTDYANRKLDAKRVMAQIYRR
ncbi:hypothetical protein F4780DRAFT_661367 [Xylariomycetidae sp. FL0641]|nr:hypothetical protein F4780DRAFT_661367 [Xylariomycetidae sp. FL0641]